MKTTFSKVEADIYINKHYLALDMFSIKILNFYILG